MMRCRRRARFVAAALMLWFGALGQGIAAEVIHAFDATVMLDKSGELTVTERIQARAEGFSIQHGIFRDFPLTFTDAQGQRHEVAFKLIDITRDGKPEPYSVKRDDINGVVHIYAGDAKALLRPGDYTYVIRYRTARQVRWFDGKPELNWNVTGNFWTFPIAAATYRLELADGLRPVRWTAYTGRLGERGTDWRGEIDASGALTVATTRQLEAGEGLTVVAALPDGAVAPPTRSDERGYWLRDNRAWILSAFGFALVFGYYLAAWNAVGRDPKHGVIIPLFHPPQGISPALANYIDHWGFGRDQWRAFTAAVLSLAVQGRVRMDDSGGALTLQAIGADVPAVAGERAIIERLAAEGGTLVIDKKNGEAVARIGSEFTAAIEAENKDRFFRRNLGYVGAGLLLTAAVLFGVIAYGGLGSKDFVAMLAFGVFGLGLGFYLVRIITMVIAVDSFFTAVRSALLLIMVSIWGLFLVNIVPWARVLPGALHFLQGRLLPLLFIGGFAALNGLFFYLMRAPTALGRPVMDQIAGFKLYLQTAESNRLNLQAPDFTAERFEALLPYAVALHVEKPWSDAFAAALKRAHPEEADPMRHYQPAWGRGVWSSANFGSAIASTVASASSALSSAVPASSASSGFSSGGGGSGGGGG
ncbi:MAG: DUF2207 domain-containing protein, partial [Desulfobulbus sp.]|nr:DUF2207 domain-containing protein [Desulfobulbus sp.]